MNQTAQYIIEQSNITPTIGIVLGSGLDRFCDKLDSSVTIEYNKIPNFRETSVKGHKGEFVLGNLHGQNIICAYQLFFPQVNFRNFFGSRSARNLPSRANEPEKKTMSTSSFFFKS